MLRVMLLAGLAAFAGCSVEAQAQTNNRWCPESCRLMCRLTVGAGVTPESCYERFRCDRFKNKNCMPPARVRARARTFCLQRGYCEVK